MAVRSVGSTLELDNALKASDCDEIVVTRSLFDVPTIRLRPGQSLKGSAGAEMQVDFVEGSDGVLCSTDNTISQVSLRVSPKRRAIANDTSVASLGSLRIKNTTTVGSVQILAQEALTGGSVDVFGLHIIDSDTTGLGERPHAYGVKVLQGAFTLWNMQPEPSSVIHAVLDGISVGCQEKPIYGTGIFVSGAGDEQGSVEVEVLRTGSVFTDGRIREGTPDQISGGVFVLYGAKAQFVENIGPVVTFGSNDMALDNWGTVDRWAARATVTTHGPSAIGFVNFGTLHDLQVSRAIETFGVGARGFNVYAGTVRNSEFDRIVTHGDGAVGMQISQPVGRMVVNRGIETFGATGPSLVKGVVTQLSAIPLSIKAGGDVEDLSIYGGLVAHGQGIPPLELDGLIRNLSIRGGVGAGNDGP